MVDFLYAIIGFVIVISILVTVHEFGHFFVAQRLGVKVLRFSIGFGPPLWSRRFGADNWEFVIAAIPLGGYVKMLGEQEDDVPVDEQQRAFHRQPLGVRFAVALAGPLANLVFAVVVFWLMFLAGINGLTPVVTEVAPGSIADRGGIRDNDRIVAVADQETRTWAAVVEGILGKILAGNRVSLSVEGETGDQRLLTLNFSGVSVDDFSENGFFRTLGAYPPKPLIPAVIGQVIPGEPARKAGLRPGDTVLSIDGRAIADWRDMRREIQQRPGQDLLLRIRRDGTERQLVVRPRFNKENSVDAEGIIGAVVAKPDRNALRDSLAPYYINERYGPIHALERALSKTGEASLTTLRLLWKIITLEVSFKNLSGPIGIAQYAGVAVQTDVAEFLQLLGFLSVSIGLLNLLPIPVLDGGHIMYYCIEFLKGGPVTALADAIGQRVGIAMLAGLMGLVIFNDLVRVLR